MAKKLGITASVRGFLRSTRAVSALEYAILVGVIVVAVVAALGTFGDDIEDAIEAISTKVDTEVDGI